MNMYYVYVTDGYCQKIEGDDAEITQNGDLVILVDGTLYRAYAAGTWRLFSDATKPVGWRSSSKEWASKEAELLARECGVKIWGAITRAIRGADISTRTITGTLEDLRGIANGEIIVKNIGSTRSERLKECLTQAQTRD